ncbi:MAG: hypothetical protein A2506_06300 [Elusimicrobia bacterium RIFOXYD12_FULL_66_9]|nr:MAG: hypothetical protein A2506_06300 [Elusimicrobia bacterium RIFOXYD12_FULL_66_9]
MGELKAADIDRDIASVVRCEDGFPIDEIERLLKAGARALPRVHEALAGPAAGAGRDLLPLIVILGELRSPSSLPVLAALLREPRWGEIPMDAASEALGKFGAAATPVLLELLSARAAPRPSLTCAMTNLWRQKFSGFGTRTRIRPSSTNIESLSSMSMKRSVTARTPSGLMARASRPPLPRSGDRNSSFKSG